MVLCAQNRVESRYDAECVNARQAVSLVEAREERARREALEAQSALKREALRRTQEAAAEARRRSAVVAALLRGEEEAPDRFSALRSGDGATELPLRWLYSVVRIANV